MTELTPDLSESMELLDIFQIEELTQQLEKKIEINPNDLRSLLMLGSGYYLRGKIVSAIQVYQQAIKVNPQLPYAYYYLGVSYYRQARLNDAVDTFKKVLDLAPHFLMAYYWLGIANWHKGDYQQARVAFEKLLSENDESPIAHFHAALACIEEQAFECALQHLQALAGIVQDDSRVQLYLGQVLYRLNRIDEAIAAYKKGLQLSPNDHKIKEALKYLTEVPEP
jgi:tetratricopeptide (TPR) repeat protein